MKKKWLFLKHYLKKIYPHCPEKYKCEKNTLLAIIVLHRVLCNCPCLFRTLKLCVLENLLVADVMMVNFPFQRSMDEKITKNLSIVFLAVQNNLIGSYQTFSHKFSFWFFAIS